MICASCADPMPPGARFCPSCGAPAAPAESAEERKLVTAVFCDLVGSTELSEKLDPETLRSVTLRYFAAMRAPIEEFGGTVEKFIGDAVMAVFGVPVMHEDDATRAAAAALGMVEALAGLNRELSATLGVRLQVRIGVHTGPAVTSTEVSTRQALVSGETVNIAARLEQNARPGEILIGPVCRRAIGPSARTESVGLLHLKGKEEPVEAYRLLGLDESTPELMRRFDLPFVGRAAELGALARALDGAARGAGSRFVAVLGEPGIGKTRLARAWLDQTSRSIALGTGRCRPYGDHGTLTPLADAVRQLLAGPVGPELRGECGEALAVLDVGLLRDGTPGPAFDGTCSALARLLAAAARRQPVVVVVDDCQWSGDLMLDALDRLAADLGPAAVLIVGLARLDLLDRRPAWGGAAALTLAGLSAEESAALAAALAPPTADSSQVPDPETAAPGSLPSPLLESAGGNPFYLEQLLAAAAETDESGSLPHTLQSLLGARLDAVDRTERVTLDLAAVLGRDVTLHQLAALAEAGPEGSPGGMLHAAAESPAAPTPIRAALTRLSRRRLVESAPGRAPGDPVFRFSSTLVHEAAYQAMAKRTRADRHERAAGVVEGEATVGRHMESAYRYRAELGLSDAQTDDLRLRAAALLIRAGSQASDRSDLARADTLLERAVALLTVADADWAQATRRLADVRASLGRTAEAGALLQAVLTSSSDPLQLAHAKLALAVAGSASTADIAQAARAALPVFDGAGDHLGLARADIRIAQEHQLDGRHGAAGELLVSGLRHAVRCDAEPERALALGAIGVSLWRGPEPAAPAVAMCRALLAEHGGPRPTVRVTLSCPLAVLLALGDAWTEARALLAEAGAVVAELGYAEGTIVVPVFAAAVESLAGQPDQALELLAQAADEARRLDADGLAGAIARESARLLADAGFLRAAADRLASVGTAPALLRSDAADLDGLRARIASAAGRVDEALALAERAVSGAATTDSPVLRAVAQLDRAEVLEAAGRLEAAAAAAAAARRLYQAKGHLPGARRAARFQARLAAGRASARAGKD